MYIFRNTVYFDIGKSYIIVQVPINDNDSLNQSLAKYRFDTVLLLSPLTVYTYLPISIHLYVLINEDR